MDIMSVLGVAIGLVTVYLVLALSVSAANEAIAAALSSRGRWLKKGVLALLSPAGKPGGTAQWLASLGATQPSAAASLVEQTYQSPFISHLAQGPLGHGFTPSYVPAWTLLQGMLYAATQKAQASFTTLAQIRDAALRLPAESPLRVALLNLSDGCNGSVELFRQRFETWFAEFENQVIAWYRQKTHAVLLVLSLCLAAAGNVDTLALTRQLSQDPKVRELLVKQGLAMAQATDAGALLDTQARDEARQAHQARQAEEDEARAALAQAAKAPQAPGDTPAAEKARAVEQAANATQDALTLYLSEQKNVEKRAIETINTLDASGLGLGWAAGEWSDLSGLALLLKLLGLMLSGLAISLGAPFWFDVLKNLASTRSVGRNLVEKATPAKA